MNLYEDEAMVEFATRLAIRSTGSRLLQAHRFSVEDREHVGGLLEIFAFPIGERIADVGCGVGELALLLKEVRADLEFVLINPSPVQLAMCPVSFDLRLGSAEKLPLEAREVGAVMMTYALGHVDLDSFISECKRVLEKGGHVYLYDLFVQGPSRVEEDLGYKARTLSSVRRRFVDGGFGYLRGRSSGLVPRKVLELMPRPDTLEGTHSAALVFGL
jgi:SAM-dependent methyltransferase